MTYEVVEAGWQRPAPAGAPPGRMEPSARTVGAAGKGIVSSAPVTLD